MRGTYARQSARCWSAPQTNVPGSVNVSCLGPSATPGRVIGHFRAQEESRNGPSPLRDGIIPRPDSHAALPPRAKASRPSGAPSTAACRVPFTAPGISNHRATWTVGRPQRIKHARGAIGSLSRQIASTLRVASSRVPSMILVVEREEFETSIKFPPSGFATRHVPGIGNRPRLLLLPSVLGQTAQDFSTSYGTRLA